MQQIGNAVDEEALPPSEVAGRLLAHRAVLRALAQRVFADVGHHLSTRELVLLHTLSMDAAGTEPGREAALDELDRIFDLPPH